jgi:hypothetical protein
MPRALTGRPSSAFSGMSDVYYLRRETSQKADETAFAVRLIWYTFLWLRRACR